MLGVGIALAGACPGTSLAQIGAGYKDAWFVVLGGIAGAMSYGYFDAPITAYFAEKGAKVGFDQLLGQPFWVVALGFAAVLVVVLTIIEKLQPWHQEIGEDFDGLSRAAPGPGRATEPRRA